MNTPIYNMLLTYAGGHPIPFHMPGHVMGRGLAGFLKKCRSAGYNGNPRLGFTA